MTQPLYQKKLSKKCNYKHRLSKSCLPFKIVKAMYTKETQLQLVVR